MSTDYYLNNVIYKSRYYNTFRHQTYFNNVNIDTFLNKFNIDIKTCRKIENTNEFKKQMKLLHFLIYISYPLVDKKIIYQNKLYKIDSIKLSCYQTQMPLHFGAVGDNPHFSLEIKVGGIPTMCHLYLDGTLTSMYSGVLSFPQTLESFNNYVELHKKTLNPKAKVFKPKSR